jgi:hypothetical protein
MSAPPAVSSLESSGPRATSATTARHIVYLSLFALLVCAPVLYYGMPDWGNDSIQHARWTKNFDIQLWNGELYPRWLSGVNDGFGGPSFMTYPPLASYVGAVFWPFVKDSPRSGWYAIGLSCVLSMVLSGIGCYFWCRSFAVPNAALFAGAVYVIVPYHLAVNMYTHGAAGQLWGVVWLPLILLAVDGVIRGSRWAMVGLTISYFLLMFTHLPTTECFSLVPLAAAVFLSDSGKRLRTLLKVAGAMAIGAGLAAVYFVPAILEGPNVHMEGMQSPEFDYHRWWLFQIQPLFDARTRLLLLTLVTLAFLAAAFWLCLNLDRTGRPFRLAVFQFCVAVGTVVMASQLSAPLWFLIPPLHLMQFPHRFFTVLGVMVAGLAALAFPFLPLPRFRIVTAFMGLMLLAWIGGTAWAAKNAFSVWRPFAQKQAAFYDKYNAYQVDMTEFWPRWTRMEEVNGFPEFEEFVAANPPKAMHLMSAAGQEVGAIHVETWRPRHIVTKVEAPEPVRLTINHFYYPGWVGHVEGSNAEVPVTPTIPDGFMQMDLPKGAYLLTVDLEKEPAERAGGEIAFISLLLTLGIAVWAAMGTNRTRTGRQRFIKDAL